MPRALTRACLLLCLASCLSPALFARARFWGYAEQGGKQVFTAGQPSSSPRVMGSFPGSTVTVRNPDNSLATLYSDLTGTAKTNPFTTDSTGLWFFYADALSYNVTFSGTGVATPFTITVIDESNICGYDILYPTLAAAVAGIPAYGCLNLVGTWTLTSPITVSRSNISIYGQPGSLIKAGANNVWAFNFTGDNQTVQGVNFDGRFSQSGYTVTYGIVSTAATKFKAKWNTVANTSGGGIQAVTSCTDCYFGHNTYTDIGNGVVADTAALDVSNPDNVAIEYETMHNMTSGNFIHLRSNGGGSVPHGSVTIDHVFGKGAINRLGIEASMISTRSLKVTNCQLEDVGWAYSLTMQHGGGTPIEPEDELIVENNSANFGTFGATGYAAFELFSNYLRVTNNTVTGAFPVGVVYSNGGVLTGNVINSANIGFNQDSSDETTVPNALKIAHNVCHEVVTSCIIAQANRIVGSDSGLTIEDNDDFRTAVPADATTSHTFLTIGMQTVYAAANVTNNHVFLKGTVPGGFAFECFHVTADTSVHTNPITFDGNTCSNLTAANFGRGWSSGGANEFEGVTMMNTVFTGILTIGSGYSSSTALVYANNRSIVGLAGGSAVTDFTIGPYFPSDYTKTVLTFSGHCTGAVANATDTAMSLWGMEGAGTACNAGIGSSGTGIPTPRACTIVGLTVKSSSAGADASDGVIKVYHNATYTGTTCTIGTGTSCTSPTIAGSFSAGESVNILMTSTSTSLSNMSAVLQCKP